MSARRDSNRSVLTTALIHFGASVCTFGAIAGIGAAAIFFLGDRDDAGPHLELAMFDEAPGTTRPELKTRLADTNLPEVRVAAFQLTDPRIATDEPTLDVRMPDPYGMGDAAAPVAPAADVEPQTVGVRINGRTVLPGEALSEVETLGALPPSPIDGLHKRSAGGLLPIIAEDGRQIADAYARPHYNRTGQPAVSIIVGGLGINYAHTRSAIDELPPEVTLSFAPHARGLQTWIRRAREAGHEVLIELPLEPHDHGRVRPHPSTLRSDLDAGANTARLEALLSQVHGYYGVINYQGDKFVTSEPAAETLFSALKSRGVAFFEDGSLKGTTLRTAAAEAGARYSRADYVIDARIEADAMRGQLMALETAARENGGALGTAIAYPLTLDIVKEWTDQLAEKGVTLAPASTLQGVPAALANPDRHAALTGNGRLP